MHINHSTLKPLNNDKRYLNSGNASTQLYMRFVDLFLLMLARRIIPANAEPAIFPSYSCDFDAHYCQLPQQRPNHVRIIPTTVLARPNVRKDNPLAFSSNCNRCLNHHVILKTKISNAGYAQQQAHVRCQLTKTNCGTGRTCSTMKGEKLPSNATSMF